MLLTIVTWYNIVLSHYSKSNNIATIQAIGSFFGSFLVTSLNQWTLCDVPSQGF